MIDVNVIGTRQEMEEISSRFSKEAGSEEIPIPERVCEYPPLSEIRQQTFDDDFDDNEYSPPRQAKRNTESTVTERKKTTTSTTDALPVSRVLCKHLFVLSRFTGDTLLELLQHELILLNPVDDIFFESKLQITLEM